MRGKITVLCDNSVYSKMGVLAEHGWSVFIETEAGNFLFDTGQGLALINNAQALKKDLADIKGIIISHHHNDHTGGLASALAASGPQKVYAHPELFKESYMVRSDSSKYIGIPFQKAMLESLGAKFIFNREFTELIPGIYLTGEVPRLNGFEKGDKEQVVLSNGAFSKDQLLDDQSLIIATEKGLVVILGCSHAGINNILNYVIKKTGKSHFRIVMGGTHLGPISQEEREKSIRALKDFDIEKIGVSHCTGGEAAVSLVEVFKDRFFFCNVGTVIEF